ncbi:uncharacterized protein LAESUDRAFT_713204 [Laetiporus sulphureus 93-53]|uniref:Uncharacterized protein n=1 Tax=Laetiporus sulphureus 93-53 TaxID=1314785 RepID=A0A165EVU1_9APHY|nr:uncharacterized protein LAESUDRAFT_713204 [Laetiporus sulphureus 93-53]KZT07871.1 hypothetical protein LAESUDRAFT_713204 [Laetiporus sulphureus 93-53]
MRSRCNSFKAEGHHASVQTRQCERCHKTFNAKGITSHERKCLREARDRDRDAELLRELVPERIVETDGLQGAAREFTSRLAGIASLVVLEAPSLQGAASHYDGPPLCGEMPLHEPAECPAGASTNDLNAVFHPRARTPMRIQSFEEYGRDEASQAPPPQSEKPWRPFRMRTDFEFAEIALNAALNKNQVNALINIINAVASGKAEFTIASDVKLHKYWEQASVLLTPFEQYTVDVPYKKEVRSFELYGRDLWEWCLDLLCDP